MANDLFSETLGDGPLIPTLHGAPGLDHTDFRPCLDPYAWTGMDIPARAVGATHDPIIPPGPGAEPYLFIGSGHFLCIEETVTVLDRLSGWVAGLD